MIAVESNILIYAHKTGAPDHAAASGALAGLVETGQQWSIPMPCLHEFYSISTHPRRYSPPSTAVEAFAQIDAWIEGGAVLIGEASDHLGRLRQLVIDGKIVDGMVHDAKIAAICLSHGISELWTADRDFSRFPALKTHNPLISTGKR